MKKIYLFLLLMIFLPAKFLSANQNQLLTSYKQTVGRIEDVIIANKNLRLQAKLDTGAFMSSLTAQDIKIFREKNKVLVRFTIYLTPTQKITFIEPLVNYAYILKRQEEKQMEDETALTTKQYAPRPVVILPICLGNKKSYIKVNLVDRSHFRYPMLLGTDALKRFDAIIDVKQTHLANTRCDG